ncbi:protein FAM167B-like [Argonauta hians]
MDIECTNTLQKAMNNLIPPSDLPTRFFERSQSHFVSSPKDSNYNSLECNPPNLLKQNVITNDLSSDMARLKATTTRLKLATKRPSYEAWQARVFEKPTILKHTCYTDCLTDDRKNWITKSLQWITEELADMRSQDQHLARQLLCIRQDIQKIKLDKSCEVHQDMLADVQLEMEELEELAEICDQLPPDSGLLDNPLRHIGVTRMNIHSRRFSTC